MVRAAEWLLERWPPEFVSTPLHRAAQIACLKALEDDGDPIEVRAALIKAAEEADILAERDGPDFSRRGSAKSPRRGRRGSAG